MTQFNARVGAIILILFASASLSACAGRSAEPVSSESVEDITRPPQMVKAEQREVIEESDPEETISFDEWRRQRQAELEKLDKGE